MERLLTSIVSFSNGNIKCPIGEQIFTVNLPLKLFCATVANADTGSLKSLHTLFDTDLDHMLNLEKISWSKMYKILSFLTKNKFLKHS